MLYQIKNTKVNRTFMHRQGISLRIIHVCKRCETTDFFKDTIYINLTKAYFFKSQKLFTDLQELYDARKQSF
jgi:hypothetical protein